MKRSTIFLAKTALLLGLSCWSGDVYGQTQRTVTGRSGVTWQSSSRLPRPQRSIYTSSAAALAGQEEVVGEPTLDPNADASIMSGSEEIVSGDAGMIYEGDEVIIDLKSHATPPTVTWTGVDVWLVSAPTWAASKTTRVRLLNNGHQVVGSFLEEYHA